MDKLKKLINIIRIEKQQIEFIEQSYKQGLCTASEAYDATVDLLESTTALWKNELNKQAVKDNLYQAVKYN
jgi:hypothetical protein